MPVRYRDPEAPPADVPVVVSGPSAHRQAPWGKPGSSAPRLPSFQAVAMPCRPWKRRAEAKETPAFRRGVARMPARHRLLCWVLTAMVGRERSPGAGSRRQARPRLPPHRHEQLVSAGLPGPSLRPAAGHAGVRDDGRGLPARPLGRRGADWTWPDIIVIDDPL